MREVTENSQISGIKHKDIALQVEELVDNPPKI